MPVQVGDIVGCFKTKVNIFSDGGALLNFAKKACSCCTDIGKYLVVILHVPQSSG